MPEHKMAAEPRIAVITANQRSGTTAIGRLLGAQPNVRYAGEIRKHFDYLRSGEYDVVSSPRVSMTPNLEAAALARWDRGHLLRDLGDGCGMWPAFVFAFRQHLLETDRDYGERSWGPGMRVPGLHYTVPEGELGVADCFGGAAFQLRDKRRVLDVPQWKGPWLWPAWLYDGIQMSWFHIGSLSSSNNLGGFELPVFSDGRTMTDDQEIGEWAHRLHWWKRCLDLYGHELPDHAARYASNWERLRERVGVPLFRIEEWRDVIDQMVTWDE